MDLNTLKEFVTKIIIVKGNLIDKSGYFAPFDAIAYASHIDEYQETEFVTIHTGDFILEETNKNSYFSYLFLIERDCILYREPGEDADIRGIPFSFNPVFDDFQNETTKVLELVQDYKESNWKQEVIYKMGFSHLFTIYESILIKLLQECIRIKPKKAFEYAPAFKKMNLDLTKEQDILSMEKKCYKAYLKYSKFYSSDKSDNKKDSLIKFYKDVFNVDLPKDQNIFGFHELRNHLMHRNGIDLNEQKVIVTLDDIIKAKQALDNNVKSLTHIMNEINIKCFDDFQKACLADNEQPLFASFRDVIKNIEKRDHISLL